MRWQIDRHTVDRREEIGAVVEVEAAKEILIRLSGAAVLRHHHARDDLEDLSGTEPRPCRDLRLTYATFRGARCDLEEALPTAADKEGRKLALARRLAFLAGRWSEIASRRLLALGSFELSLPIPVVGDRVGCIAILSRMDERCLDLDGRRLDLRRLRQSDAMER